MPEPRRTRPNLIYVAVVLAAAALLGLWLQGVVDGDEDTTSSAPAVLVS